MSQTSTERLRDYLAQLPPQSQALLMREFERAIERGEDTTVASFVLEQLRKVVRGNDDEAEPRTNDPARLLFRPLEPFLVETNFPVRPGQVRRASLLPVWQWLTRDGAPEQAREFEAVLVRMRQDGTASELEPAIRKLQLAAVEAILRIASPGPGGDKHRALARGGPPDVIADLLPSALVLQAREALDTLGSRLPSYLRMFADQQIGVVSASLNVASLQTPQLLPFALSLVLRAMANHPLCHQDGRLGRRNPRCRHSLWRRRHHRAARSVFPRGQTAVGYQARPFRQCRRASQDPSRRRARLADRTRSAQRFHLGQTTDLDPGRYFQRPAIGNRQCARPGPPSVASARRQGYRRERQARPK